MIEHSIDYLVFSLNIDEMTFIERKLPMLSPQRFYPRRYLGDFGMEYAFGNPNTTKALVTATGKALERARQAGISDFATIENAISRGALISRIDLCITKWIDDWFIDMDEIAQWSRDKIIKSAHAKYPTKSINEVQAGGDIGESLYIGDWANRGKKGIFRAYDKGIDLKLDKWLATRLELEEKQGKAHRSAKRILETQDIGAVFRSRFDVKNDKFQELTSLHVAPVTRGIASPKQEREEANEKRWNWLIKQVAPALHKAIQEDINLHGYSSKKFQFMASAGMIDDVLASDKLDKLKLYGYYEAIEKILSQIEKGYLD